MVNNYGVIYLLFNTITRKVYVGQTSISFNIRLRNHKNDKHKDKLHNSIRKHGWDIFDKFIIDIAHSKEDLDTLEQYYIEKFQSVQFGYNLKSGGANGKCSADTKLKMSLSRLGNKNPNFGKHTRHSLESKNNIKKAAKNKKPIKCLETTQVFESIREAARILGLHPSNIRLHLSGKKSHVKRFHFERVQYV